MSTQKQSIISAERIATGIYVFREKNVMLDSDLAELYGVETRVLNQAVQRNINRFPDDFMFQLNDEEFEDLKSHFAVSNEDKNLRSQIVISRWGGRRYPPYAFTELGIAMLSSVLRSQQAIEVNISIMRTFVRLRQMLASNEELARKVKEHDHHIGVLYEELNKLLMPPEPPPKNQMGFKTVKHND